VVLFLRHPFIYCHLMATVLILMAIAVKWQYGIISNMSKFSNHRAAVKAALKHLGKTRYWLSDELEGEMSRSTLYGYIAGKRELTSDKMEAINKVLGIRYTDE
jgi:hypothetical protein